MILSEFKKSSNKYVNRRYIINIHKLIQLSKITTNTPKRIKCLLKYVKTIELYFSKKEQVLKIKRVTRTYMIKNFSFIYLKKVIIIFRNNCQI